MVVFASAGLLPAYEEHAPAHYDFSYSVHDGHTGDVKQQQESRRGDAVQGSYSLGVFCTVKFFLMCFSLMNCIIFVVNS